MSLVDHIVTAVDFSKPSEVALRAAFRLACEVGANQLTVLHAVRAVVLPHGTDGQAQLIERLTALRERIRKAADDQLHALVSRLNDSEAEVDVHYEVVEGHPAEVIPDRAKALGGTLLVVGTHARSGLWRWIHGSIAENMLCTSGIPVLVMAAGNDGVDPDAEIKVLKNIVVGVDFDAKAGEVVEAAAEVGRVLHRHEPKITLLSVLGFEPVFGPDDLDAEHEALMREPAEKRLGEMAEHVDGDFELAMRLEKGRADERILEVAKELKAELIVMGSHGHGGSPLFQLGSTTLEVVRRSDVSVLVIPSHGESDA